MSKEEVVLKQPKAKLGKLIRKEKMTLSECEKLAKIHGHDSATFELHGPTGFKGAKWLDAYFGMFIMDETEGFVMVSQAEDWGLWAENFRAPAKAKGEPK